MTLSEVNDNINESVKVLDYQAMIIYLIISKLHLNLYN